MNPLLCDPVTGLCEIPTRPVTAAGDGPADAPKTGPKPVRIVYFTDPICSSCWGIEPQLRRLKLEYGDYLDIDYRMGGLLQSWDTYGGRDVNGPASVAHHWEEVSAHYDMPIDGGVWLEDPLASSYPPSIAFKAAQMQDAAKAVSFLRRIREMVFLEKKNISRWEHLAQAAAETGLDVARLKADYDGPASALFEADLALAQASAVRGFPTLFLSDAGGNRLTVYGFKPYGQFENAVLSLYPDAVKTAYDAAPEALFARYPTLTTKEFATLTGSSAEEAVRSLTALEGQGRIGSRRYGAGVMWTRKSD